MKEKQKRKKQSTNALQVAFIDSETKLHHIIDALPDGIVIVDMDLKVLDANEAAAHIAGLTRKEDLIGRKGLDFVSPKHMDQIAESLLGASKGRPEERVQISIVDACGKEVDIELSISTLNDSSGNQTGFVVMGRDVTGRVRVEEALKESETRYRELFEHMSSGVVVYEAINDGNDFVFKDFNSVAERISRLSREDLIGKSILETKPGLKKFGLFDILQKVWRTGKPEYMPVSYYEDEHVSGWRENFIYKLPSGEVIAVYNDITERKKADDALRESEQKLRFMFESIGDGIAVTDMEGHIIEINEAALRMGEYKSKEEVLGKYGFGYIASAERDKVKGSLRTAFKRGPSSAMSEYKLSTPSGKELDAELSVAILRDSLKNPVGYIGVVRDITERKRSQEALRQSEEKLRLIFESIKDAVTIIDLKGFIIDVNKASMLMGGFSNKDEIVGKNGFDFIPEKDRARAVENMGRAFAKGHTATLEYTLQRKDGSEFDAEASVSFFKDASGNPAGLIAVARDITERKSIQAALAESEERYRSVVDNATEAIVVAQDGMLKFFNPKAVEIMGYPDEDLSSKSFAEFIHPEDRQMVVERHLKRLSGEETPQIYPFRIIDKKGNTKWLEINAVVIDWEGRPATLNFLNDITARKKAEEALRESEEKLRFMFESMGDAIVVIDLKGKVIEVNERLIAMSGYESREQVLGEMPLNSLLRGFALGQWKISRTAGRQVSTTVEYVAVDRYGREFDVEASGAVLRDAAGKSAGFILALRDVSDRKRMEKTLRESEEKLRLTFESIADMLIVMDLKGYIVDVNDAVLRTLGYSKKEDIIGHHSTELVLAEERDEAVKNTIKAIQQGLAKDRSGYQNLNIVTSDGRTLHTEYGIALMRQKDGGLSGVIGVARDITERKRTEEAIRRRNIELTAIASVTQSLSHQLKLNKVLQIALDKILDVSGLSVGAIWLLDDEKKVLELAISRGVGNKFVKAVSKMPLDAGITARAIETGRTVVVTDVQRDKKLPPKYKATAKLEKLQSVVSIPLKSKGETLGAMNVFSRERLHFSADDLRLLQTVSGQIGIAIDNAQLLEKLSELSKTDELTGLYNRRTFFEMLNAELSHSSRYSRPFSLVMLDLDNFKSFNDRFGHTSGDAALRKFGNAMKSALRKTDAAFRYGGDEFTIIFPSTEAKKSRHIIERIRRKWLQTQHNQYPNVEITIDFSVGIAQYPDDTETIDGLIFLADTALLIAKREGGYKSTLVSELGQLPPDVLGTTTLEQVYKLAATVDAKALYAEGHSKRVAIVAETLGKGMGLDEEQLSQLRVAALLHDIGKIGVPDLIMSKPYGLSKDERRVIEKHPSEGAKILSHVRELSAVVPIVLHHHEWYNGAGYPNRLKSEDIPFLSRILTIADSYDTMTTPLPHKKAMTHEEAMDELRRYSGMQFDPEIVEEFCRNVSADDIRGQI